MLVDVARGHMDVGDVQVLIPLNDRFDAAAQGGHARCRPRRQRARRGDKPWATAMGLVVAVLVLVAPMPPACPRHHRRRDDVHVQVHCDVWPQAVSQRRVLGAGCQPDDNISPLTATEEAHAPDFNACSSTQQKQATANSEQSLG